MPFASVIITTYNRAVRLRRAIESVLACDVPREQFEIVVVDSNSTDETREVVAAFAADGVDIHRVEEPRLSVTVARHAGAAAARGDVLVYVDDDAVVDPKWLRAVLEAFASSDRIGVVGGPIHPEFEQEPPEWLTRDHPMSIWLSLFDLGSEADDVDAVAGPNLAVRKDVLERVGGFPADTLGVDAEGREGVVQKIYVGPGDGGLCRSAREAGYRVRYVPDALVHHVIPPVRMTKEWWHARLAGEGCAVVITYQHRHHRGRLALAKSAFGAYVRALVAWARTWSAAVTRGRPERHEFMVSYHRAGGRTSLALARHPWLADELWNADLSGVTRDDVRRVVSLLPSASPHT